MTQIFKNKDRKTGFALGVIGTGSFTIDAPFLPDYIHAKFATQGTQGKQHDGKASHTDTIYWELTSVTPTDYTVTIHYVCGHQRDIQWMIAKLPKVITGLE